MVLSLVYSGVRPRRRGSCRAVGVAGRFAPGPVGGAVRVPLGSVLPGESPPWVEGLCKGPERPESRPVAPLGGPREARWPAADAAPSRVISARTSWALHGACSSPPGGSVWTMPDKRQVPGSSHFARGTLLLPSASARRGCKDLELSRQTPKVS